VPPSAEDIHALLKTFDRVVVSRGRDYAARGRVGQVRREPDEVHAVVRGTQPYRVEVGLLNDGEPYGRCSCMAFDREGQCKHIAALALTLYPAAAAELRARSQDVLPAVFESAYSAAKLIASLSLYAGEALQADIDDRYCGVTDWWWQSIRKRTDAGAALRKRVLELAPEVQSTFDTLKSWKAPPTPRPGTSYATFYERLAQLYERTKDKLEVRSVVPGPLDARHPGFAFRFDSSTRRLTVQELPAPLLPKPLRLGFVLPLDPGGRLEVDELGRFGGLGELDADAWEVFALRELLIALAAVEDPALKLLARELGRPIWDHVLDELDRAPKDAVAKEWSFVIVVAYRVDEYRLVALSRGSRSGRSLKWKRQSFETLLTEAMDGDSDDEIVAIEREIARLAMCTTTPYMRQNEAPLSLGSAQGHELLSALARHPRCSISRLPKVDMEATTPIDLVVGKLSMRLDRGPNGSLVPRFFAEERELPIPVSQLVGAEQSPFRAGVTGQDPPRALVSVLVPTALRPWVRMAARLGSGLEFPPEAVSKLATVTQPLVAKGSVQLPREALGEELPYQPTPALRVEWLPGALEDGGVAAMIEVVIAVHPLAPLVAAGSGPRLFTFQNGETRVFVEREREGEEDRAAEMVATLEKQIEAPVIWVGLFGRTTSTAGTIALAAYLERNPLGLAIEVKVGRPPQVVPWPKNAEISVTKARDWLVIDGALDVHGEKITLGEVLEAVRHAQCYVKAQSGVFLELSTEAMTKLRPVAMATELAPKGAGGGARDVLNDAFGAALLGAADLFGTVRTKGVELNEYARRIDKKRERGVRAPTLERGELREYQREGVLWMLRLATWAPGCVLADDMGLGKTVQTAAVLKARAERGPALIIAPASVSSNWVTELARFVPSMNVSWYNAERRDLAELGAGDVLIVSYGLLQRQSKLFAARRFATVVVDEAQYVKNIDAQRSDAVRGLDRDLTIALTGTPLENHLGELYSIVDIAFPRLLGDDAAFRGKFRRPIEGQNDSEALTALGKLLAPFLLRRTRASVLRELPPRQDIVEYVDLSPDEARHYLALRRACENQMKTRPGDETQAQFRIWLLAALTRLRQLACDVSLVDPTFEGTSTKLQRAVEIVSQLAAEGNRALVFSQFTTFLDKVRVALEAAGLRVAYLTGETPTTKRRPIIDAFQAGEYDVFCVSLLAGGTGLNLTKANYVVHLDPWWNPAAEEQATSRAHRMGQTEPVTVYRMVSRGTIEEAVLALHEDKKKLAAAVLDGKANPKSVSSAELLELLRFGE
jgi:superfamily II DNA or RNA helicase